MTHEYTFSTVIERGHVNIELIVSYTITRYIPATHWQPAEGGEIEIVAVTWDGRNFDTTAEEEDNLRDYINRNGYET